MTKKTCLINKCEDCNAFNLYYKGVQIHINFKTLQFMLTNLYQYDSLNMEIRKGKPFRIKIHPILLTVNNEDYIQFKDEVEKALTKNLIIPQLNIYNFLNN